MAKGGINLNPGADATLVTAATRAAMANVPKDLSGIFEGMSKSYASAMDKMGAGLAKFGEVAGYLGAQAVKKAIKNQKIPPESEKYEVAFERKEGGEEGTETFGDAPTAEQSGPRAEGTSNIETPEIPSFKEWVAQDPTTRGGADAQEKYNTWKEQNSSTPSTTKSGPQKVNTSEVEPITIGDELRRIRKELNGMFLKNDKKSKIRKHELKAERAELLNNLAILEDSNNFNNEMLANNTFSAKGTGMLNLLAQNALHAWKTKSGVIQEGPMKGYRAILTKDKDGDLGFMFKGPGKDGKIVTGEYDNKLATDGDKPYVVKTKDMNNLLVPKFDTETKGKMNKEFQKLLKDFKSISYDKIGFKNKMRDLIGDNVYGAMSERFANMGGDFVDIMHSQNEYSAEAFAATSMTAEQGKAMGLTDVDGDGYIGDNPTTKEVETGDYTGDKGVENFRAFKDIILNRHNKYHSKERTLDMLVNVLDDVGAKMHEFNNPGAITTNRFADIGASGLPLAGIKVGKGQLETIRTKIIDGKSFSINSGNNQKKFTPDTETGEWIQFKVSKTGKETEVATYDNTQDMILNGLATSHKGFQGLQQFSFGVEKKENYQLGTFDDNSKIRSNVRMKYTGERKDKSASPKRLLGSLQSYFELNKKNAMGADFRLNTVGDLQKVIAKVKSDSEFRDEFIKWVSSKAGLSIKTGRGSAQSGDGRRIVEMLEKLIERSTKELKRS